MAVLSAVVGLSAIGAQPASAATARLLLMNGGCEPGYQGFTVRGTTSRAYPGGRKMVMHVMGEDTFSDDHLLGPLVRVHPGNFPAQTFFYEEDLCVDFETLDEDIGKDDIYIRVNFTTMTNAQVETARTNTFHGSF